MRNLLLAAAATVAIASPAAARDGSMYAEIDAGVMFPRSNNVFGSIDFIDPLRSDFPATSFASVRYKVGYDVDLNAGYDFGMFRLEGELGYKHAKIKSTSLANNVFTNALNFGSGNAFTSTGDFGFRDNASIFSGMVNGYVDFGGNDGPGGYVGAGAGYANVKQFNGSKGRPRLATASRRLYAHRQQYRHRAEVSLLPAGPSVGGLEGLRLHARSRHLRNALLVLAAPPSSTPKGIGSRTA